MAALGRIAGKGAGEGDLPARSPLCAASRGELAANEEEKDDRRDEGILLGGFMLDNGVEGTAPDGLLLTDPAAPPPTLLPTSGKSEAMVTTEPVSEALDPRRPMDGLRALNEGGLEDRISMLV